MRRARKTPSFSPWDELKICDWCGRSTRGRTYVDEPDVVYCTSCHTHLEGNPPKDVLKDDVDRFCGTS